MGQLCICIDSNVAFQYFRQQASLELRSTAYKNDRKPNRTKFSETAIKKIGRHYMKNRLMHVNNVDFDWIAINITKDFLRAKIEI